MINFFVQMKLNKFAYLYSKPLGNHTLKIMKKYLEIYFKNLEKSWNFISPKNGNLESSIHEFIEQSVQFLRITILLLWERTIT